MTTIAWTPCETCGQRFPCPGEIVTTKKLTPDNDKNGSWNIQWSTYADRRCDSCRGHGLCYRRGCSSDRARTRFAKEEASADGKPNTTAPTKKIVGVFCDGCWNAGVKS